MGRLNGSNGSGRPIDHAPGSLPEGLTEQSADLAEGAAAACFAVAAALQVRIRDPEFLSLVGASAQQALDMTEHRSVEFRHALRAMVAMSGLASCDPDALFTHQDVPEV